MMRIMNRIDSLNEVHGQRPEVTSYPAASITHVDVAIKNGHHRKRTEESPLKDQ